MESKFINKATLDYLDSQVKGNSSERIDSVEEKISEVVKFLYEYEAYNDELIKNVADQIAEVNRLREDQHNVLQGCHDLQVKISDIRRGILNAQLKKIVIGLIAVAVAVVGLGVALWLK